MRPPLTSYGIPVLTAVCDDPRLEVFTKICAVFLFIRTVTYCKIRQELFQNIVSIFQKNLRSEYWLRSLVLTAGDTFVLDNVVPPWRSAASGPAACTNY